MSLVNPQEAMQQRVHTGSRQREKQKVIPGEVGWGPTDRLRCLPAGAVVPRGGSCLQCWWPPRLSPGHLCIRSAHVLQHSVYTVQTTEWIWVMTDASNTVLMTRAC